TWARFKREFLTKYFPTDERNHKVIEFMELKQGSMYVSEYAAKFEELCRLLLTTTPWRRKRISV
ncbi:hypothetical protein A2U01_0113201, partial [Trifolium medium]|nr:hypothetical protein [Trifolium medium]